MYTQSKRSRSRSLYCIPTLLGTVIVRSTLSHTTNRLFRLCSISVSVGDWVSLALDSGSFFLSLILALSLSLSLSRSFSHRRHLRSLGLRILKNIPKIRKIPLCGSLFGDLIFSSGGIGADSVDGESTKNGQLFANSLWEIFHYVVGSPYYVAPEVLNKHYSSRADVWSTGLIGGRFAHDNLPTSEQGSPLLYSDFSGTAGDVCSKAVCWDSNGLSWSRHISFLLSNIADAHLLEGDPLKIDQSALRGESFPVLKSPRDGVYSGSTCKQGEIEAVVIATGVHTFFGKAAHLVDSTNQMGHFQKVFARGVDGEAVVLMAARASPVENQDAIDAAIVVGTLADPKEAPAGIQEVHFLPFNPTDKRTALTYIDSEGKMHRVSKGTTVCCAICRICYYSK